MCSRIFDKNHVEGRIAISFAAIIITAVIVTIALELFARYSLGQHLNADSFNALINNKGIKYTLIGLGSGIAIGTVLFILFGQSRKNLNPRDEEITAGLQIAYAAALQPKAPSILQPPSTELNIPQNIPFKIMNDASLEDRCSCINPKVTTINQIAQAKAEENDGTKGVRALIRNHVPSPVAKIIADYVFSLHFFPNTIGGYLYQNDGETIGKAITKLTSRLNVNSRSTPPPTILMRLEKSSKSDALKLVQISRVYFHFLILPKYMDLWNFCYEGHFHPRYTSAPLRPYLFALTIDELRNFYSVLVKNVLSEIEQSPTRVTIFRYDPIEED